MIEFIATLLIVFIMLINGRIFEAIKRFFVLLLKSILKILNFFGCKINIEELKIKTSKKFNETYGDIRVVKRSNHNKKMLSSVNILAIVFFLACVIMIGVNFATKGAISTYLYNSGVFSFAIKNLEQMDTTFIAITFSMMSFSLSKILHQWKETAPYREAKRQMKLRNKVVSNMTSKELLESIKEKDKQAMERLSYKGDDGEMTNDEHRNRRGGSRKI